MGKGLRLKYDKNRDGPEQSNLLFIGDSRTRQISLTFDALYHGKYSLTDPKSKSAAANEFYRFDWSPILGREFEQETDTRESERYEWLNLTIDLIRIKKPKFVVVQSTILHQVHPCQLKLLDNDQDRVDECLRVEWDVLWRTWDMLLEKMINEFSHIKFLVISSEFCSDPYEALYTRETKKTELSLDVGYFFF